MIRSRRGLSELIGLLLALPLIITAIGATVYFGRALYLQAALEDTAAVGARWASTSLSGQQGCAQALEAMRRTLRGYYIEPSGARISVSAEEVWGRGLYARVRVSYRLDQRAVPVFGGLLGPITVRAGYSTPIDTYNARHSEGGWSQCSG
jgi:Flp pilus assembly protein TadG